MASTAPHATLSLSQQIHNFFVEANIPNEVLQPIVAAIAESKQQLTAPGLNLGEKVADFRLPNQLGREVSLAETLSRGPVALKFYRGAWCPICNVELRALQQRLPEIKQLGATLLAIHPQAPEKSVPLADKLELRFDVLSDVKQEVIRANKLTFNVPDAIRRVYLSAFQLDLARETADGSWDLPIPATYVLDRNGVVRARHVDVDYTQRMEPQALIDALRSLR